MKLGLSRAEMASKMRDDGEEDDLDLERLADKETIADEQTLHAGRGFGTGRVSQRSASSGDVCSRFVGCGDGGGGYSKQSGGDYLLRIRQCEREEGWQSSSANAYPPRLPEDAPASSARIASNLSSMCITWSRFGIRQEAIQESASNRIYGVPRRTMAENRAVFAKAKRKCPNFQSSGAPRLVIHGGRTDANGGSCHPTLEGGIRFPCG